MMIKDTIFIEKPIEEVWDYIVLEYAKSFKCSPSQLNGKQIESTARSFNNKVINIKQTVVKLVENEVIEVESENSRDTVVTGYSLTNDEDGTFLTTYENGEGKESTLRSWNYKLWTFPLLNRSTKKRLRYRLETLKGLIEGTINTAQEDTVVTDEN